MKKTFTFIYLILFTSASAQETPVKKSISYMNDAGQNVSYDRVITRTETGYRVEDFYKGTEQLAESGFTRDLPEYNYYAREGNFKAYYENGNLKDEGSYHQNIYKGIRNQYFENGQLYKRSNYVRQPNSMTYYVNEVWDDAGRQLVKDGRGKSREFTDLIETGNYINGIKDSVWTGTYPDGRLCYEETYKDGQLVIGRSMDKEGNTHTYDKAFEQPVFKGGMEKFSRFLGGQIKYPSVNKTDIFVSVRFRIEKDGSIHEIFVADSYSPSADAEAVRVVSLSSGKWLPAKSRGLAQSTWYTLKISLKTPAKARLYGS
jgi:antitoxin component YwqK of YwqJK toxin-antitoxin module